MADFDFIILGAGPAGLAAADFLIKSGKKVLTIDKGSHLIQHICNDSKTAEGMRSWVVGGIGGQSRVWGAQVAFPGVAHIRRFLGLLNARSLTLQKILDEIDELAKDFNIDYDVENEYFKDHLLDSKHFGTKYSTYLKNKDLTYYFHTINSPNFSYQESEIESLHFQEKNGIHINTSAGVLRVSKETKLIIALGTLETTSLLLKSNLKRNSLIGQNLVDHPHGYVMRIHNYHPSQLRKSPTRLNKGQGYKRKFEYRSNFLDCSAVVEFHYRYDIQQERAASFFLSFALARKLINSCSFRLFNSYLTKPNYIDVWIQLEQFRHPSNKLILESGKTIISWKLNDQDISFLNEIRDALLELFLQDGAQEIEFHDLNEVDGAFVDAFHPSGTIPANRIPDLAIADEYGILHSYPNVALATSATWPIAGWHNPTFMIMVFARLAAKQMLKTSDS